MSARPASEIEDDWDARDKFAKDFKKLVRKYFPTKKFANEHSERLMMCQEATSVYNPYVWSD